MSIPGIDCRPGDGAALALAAGLSSMPGIAGMEAAESGFAGGMVMPGIASAGAGARCRAGLRTAFLAGFFATGFLATGLATAGFLAGAGIFMPGMPGMPGMSCADAGIASANAVVAATATNTRFTQRLGAGAR